MMKKNSEPQSKPFSDQFSDEKMQKPQVKFPRIDKARASAKNIDKVATSSQLPTEALPKIAKIDRQTMSSAAAEFPTTEPRLPDPHETLSSRGREKQRRTSPRRQTQLDQPALREQYEADFDMDGPVQAPLSGDEFTKEVQQQLHAISQRQAEITVVQSDLSDFEQKVNEHREMIKKEVFRKKVSLAKKQQTKPIKKRNQSLYEKRAREYRENTENKYVKEKKKEIAARELKERLKQERDKSPKELKEFKDPRERRTPGRSKSKGTIGVVHPKSVKQVPVAPRQILKPTKEKNLDANERLFENIHGILQNPHKSRSQFLSINKLKSMRGPSNKRISDLQQKIKQLQMKDPHASSDGIETTSLDMSIVQKIKDHNLLDWRRISISPQRVIMYKDSDFQSEVKRIGGFISKNEHSIDLYVKNRQLLMEIELQNKIKEVGGIAKSVGDIEQMKEMRKAVE